MINRTAVVIKPRQPFLDWIKILVSVKTRRKRIDLPLCDLEVCDEESSNYQGRGKRGVPPDRFLKSFRYKNLLANR
jgi:hypothetical protein